EEDAARGDLPRDEAPPQLREALRAPRPRARRGHPPDPQADAQAHGARGLLVLTLLQRIRTPGLPGGFCFQRACFSAAACARRSAARLGSDGTAACRWGISASRAAPRA